MSANDGWHVYNIWILYKAPGDTKGDKQVQYYP